MPRITSVEPQKTLRLRSGRRFNIYLDGQFAFGADEDLVVDKRLVVGKELATLDVEQLVKETEVGKLMERMYRLWNIRPRSEKEIRDKLRIKGKEQVSNLAIEQLINKLKEKGMINDEQFARSWVESRRKKKGPRVIKQELFQKGIDREIIEQVISEQVTGDSGQKVAEQLLEKKMRVWKNLTSREFKKKAYEFLTRRGFEYEEVNDAIEKFIKSDYNNDRESD